VAGSDPGEPKEGWQSLEVPDLDLARAIAGRIALGHRVVRSVVPVGDPNAVITALESIARGPGESGARFDWLGEPPPNAVEQRDRLVAAYRSAGGRIRLQASDREFLLVARGREIGLLLLLADIDRRSYSARRMPRLPFQRPVSLPPRLARAAVNLSRVRPGELVVDPFVGTGAMLLEAAMLGARVAGVDRDARMIQGASRNFAAFGQSPERLVAEDGESGAARFQDGSVDAVVTDPPYGRASTTRGEEPDALARRVLTAWARKIRADGRVVVVLPAGSLSPLPSSWDLEVAIPHRVHRSLTREFRVYRRRDSQ
jgi:tRNA (guanine10-N2)-dimethyltransferase